MHAYTSMDSEKVWHGCSPENCSPGLRILVGLHVLHDDLPPLVDVISVKARYMLRVFRSIYDGQQKLYR